MVTVALVVVLVVPIVELVVLVEEVVVAFLVALAVLIPLDVSFTLMSSSPVSSRESLESGPLTRADGGRVAVGDRRGEDWVDFSFWCRPGALLGGCSAWEVPRVCKVGASSLGEHSTEGALLV